MLASAKSRADRIPMGQPILVGHHSEVLDRKFRAKIHADMGKAYALHDDAADLRRQARGVGNCIRSDALEKLRAKLQIAMDSHAVMVAANKAIRTHMSDQVAALAAIMATGMLEENARVLLQPDFAGRIGFPG